MLEGIAEAMIENKAEFEKFSSIPVHWKTF